MKLHIGKMYWDDVIKSTKKLNENCNIKDLKNKESKILVVGAGMSGAISSYILSKKGYEVCLIDKGKVGMGSTLANTGLIQYMSDIGVKSLIEKIGRKDAVKFYDESIEAIDRLIEINKELDQLEEETFSIKESLILATDEKKLENIKDEVQTQKELNYDAKFLSENELENLGLKAYGALKAKPDISINPYGFVNRLVSESIEKYGLKLFENTAFLSLEDKEDYQLVTLKNGQENIDLKFKKVIFATGYNPPEFIKKDLDKLKINKTYVSVSDKNVEYKESLDYLVWEVSDAYTYFKYTFDKSFMIGGLDKEISELMPDDAEKYKDKLVSLAKEMLYYKDLNINIKYSYAALFGESEDNLPFIGPDIKNKNIFLVCGVGGNGTVYSTIASKIIEKWLNKENLSEYEFLSINR